MSVNAIKHASADLFQKSKKYTNTGSLNL